MYFSLYMPFSFSFPLSISVQMNLFYNSTKKQKPGYKLVAREHVRWEWGGAIVVAHYVFFSFEKKKKKERREASMKYCAALLINVCHPNTALDPWQCILSVGNPEISLGGYKIGLYSTNNARLMLDFIPFFFLLQQGILFCLQEHHRLSCSLFPSHCRGTK